GILPEPLHCGSSRVPRQAVQRVEARPSERILAVGTLCMTDFVAAPAISLMDESMEGSLAARPNDKVIAVIGVHNRARTRPLIRIHRPSVASVINLVRPNSQQRDARVARR